MAEATLPLRNDPGPNHNRGDLSRRFLAVRDFTVELTRTLEPEDFVVQSMPSVSPVKWHLAHTSWFFESFLLGAKQPGYRLFDPAYDYLFNSYYHQVGPMHRRADRGLLTRPTVREVLAYRAHVDDQVARLLASPYLDADAFALLELGLNHEQQHQELLLTDIKHLFAQNPLAPAFHDLTFAPSPGVSPLRFVDGASGLCAIGHDGDGFAFDNEGPRHRVLLRPHAIANRLATNSEYLAFIEDRGYQRSELWLSDGWASVKEQSWSRPLYWQADHATEFTLGGLREINADAPVSHVSFYEADAFARWAGYRLPTEAEWETWAADCPRTGNFVDTGLLHPAPTPLGADPCTGDERRQVFGDCWEWTMSSYAAYPGYQPAAGAIGEYNGKFMCNQMVLRGGSCATPSTHIRSTYRNFFYPADRWQFSGIRLAQELT